MQAKIAQLPALVPKQLPVGQNDVLITVPVQFAVAYVVSDRYVVVVVVLMAHGASSRATATTNTIKRVILCN